MLEAQRDAVERGVDVDEAVMAAARMNNVSECVMRSAEPTRRSPEREPAGYPGR